MSTVKAQYELLGVEPSASLEEIKQGYRRSMAMYHPDKLQHLGQEFVELASKRAAEITNAYQAITRMRESSAAEPVPAAVGQEPDPVGVEAPGGDEHELEDRFMDDSAVASVHRAVERLLPEAEPRRLKGFDLAYASKQRRSLFRQTCPPTLLLGRLVDVVAPDTLQEAWRQTARLPGAGETLRCLLVMGHDLAPADDLAAVIAQERARPVRSGAEIQAVPVDLRTRRCLVPSGATELVRALVAELSRDR